MNVHGKFNYVEYPALNLKKTKEFFQKAFGWEFKDFGAEYTSFSNQGLNGGFFKSELSSRTKTGGALLVFFSDNLQEINGGKYFSKHGLYALSSNIPLKQQ